MEMPKNYKQVDKECPECKARPLLQACYFPQLYCIHCKRIVAMATGTSPEAPQHSTSSKPVRPRNTINFSPFYPNRRKDVQ